MQNWSPEEDGIISGFEPGARTSAISAALLLAGYRRSVAAIHNRRARIKTASQFQVVTKAPKAPTVRARKPKILYFDLETTDLSAGFGDILMIGYRWGHEKKYKLKGIWDFPKWEKPSIDKRDKPLVMWISELLLEADVLVGHYSKRFDFKFVNTRRLIHDLPPLPPIPHIDTWEIARKNLRVGSSRLKNLAKSLELPEQKSEVTRMTWRRAKAHDLKSMKLIGEYCRQDVRTTYELAQKILPYCRDLPNWNLMTGEKTYRCANPECGSIHVVEDGAWLTKVHRYARYRCQDCGHWSRGRKTVVGKDVERHMY